jgi:hypothetical protein
VLFFGSVDQGTGVVGLTVWRLAPGGPDIHAPSTNMKVSVLVVARRQADPQLNPVAPTTNPSTNSGTVTTDPWSMLITDDLSAAANGSNTTFTLSQTPRQMLGVVWETTFHVTDYSVSGTTLTTNFKDDNGNSIAPLAGDKFYALYFV